MTMFGPTSKRTVCRTTPCTTAAIRALDALRALEPFSLAKTAGPAAGGGSPAQKSAGCISTLWKALGERVVRPPDLEDTAGQVWVQLEVRVIIRFMSSSCRGGL